MMATASADRELVESSVNSISGTTQFTYFDRSNYSATTDVKMDGFVFDEKSSFNRLRLPLPTELIWDFLLPKKSPYENWSLDSF